MTSGSSFQLFSVVMFVCFPSLNYTSGGVNSCLCFFSAVSFPGFCFPSSTFCKAGFVDTYCLNLVLSWNILFSPSMVIESFAGYSSLGLQLWSLCVCSISLQGLLAFMVSIEKSGRSAFIRYLTFFPCSS